MVLFYNRIVFYLWQVVSSGLGLLNIASRMFYFFGSYEIQDGAGGSFGLFLDINKLAELMKFECASKRSY